MTYYFLYTGICIKQSFSLLNDLLWHGVFVHNGGHRVREEKETSEVQGCPVVFTSDSLCRNSTHV